MHVIKRFSQRFSSFYFSHVDKNTVLKEIKKLNLNKAAQDSDIPVKILKQNADFFADYIYLQFNEAVFTSNLMIDKGKKAVDSLRYLGQFSPTYQKHLTAFVMICSLQN